jgi:hypothetical protein
VNEFLAPARALFSASVSLGSYRAYACALMRPVAAAINSFTGSEAFARNRAAYLARGRHKARRLHKEHAQR